MNLFECTCTNCEARFITALENDEEKCSCPACDCEDIKKEAVDPQSFGCGGGCSSCGGCN